MQKTGTNLIKIHANNTHAKVQGNTFIFGCTIAKKKHQVKLMTLFDYDFIETLFLAFLFAINKSKLDFFWEY